MGGYKTGTQAQLTPAATDALSIVLQSTVTPNSAFRLCLSKAGQINVPLTRKPIIAPNQ